MQKTRSWILPLALAAALMPLLARAQESYDDDIQQRVARIAWISGDVSYNRGDDPDAWDDASLNFPMTIGDRIWAARNGRVELQTRGASLFVAPQTDLAALNMTEDVRQFSLSQGTLSVRVRRLESDDIFEVDTPNAAVTFERAGSYRIDVDEEGNTRVVVRRGRAWVAAGGGQVPLEADDEMEIDGLDEPTYDTFPAARMDGWDRWVENRSRRLRTVRYNDWVSPDVIGYDELDGYGRWNDVPGYGKCWSPASVAAGWAPYRVGRWVWQDPWGWTWVSSEPWGFAPYHYGRWVNWSSRWWWVPSGPRARVSYSPALVVFVGGAGWNASLSSGGGYVGWFPLAPSDPFHPWWGHHRDRYDRVDRNDRNDRNVRYVNRTHVTVVRQNIFVSGTVVGRNLERDAAIVRRAIAEPIDRGPIPVLPTRASIRVSLDASRNVRPPANMVARPVVTRLAPPPAPPSFAMKLDVIRENRGAPVTPIAASRLTTERTESERTVVPIRPAAQERMVLTPRRTDTSGPRPVEVTAPPGKNLAPPIRQHGPAPSTLPDRTERDEVAPPPPAVERRPAPPPVREERLAPAPRPVERELTPAPPPVRKERLAPAPRPVERELTPAPRAERMETGVESPGVAPPKEEAKKDEKKKDEKRKDEKKKSLERVERQD